MENPQANPQAGQDGQMQQVMQMVQQMLQQGAQPVEVAQQLLQEQMPPEAIMEVFTQMGMQPEEAQATIQEAMQGGQQQPQGPGEEQMEGQASNPQEEQAEQQGAPMQQGMPPSPGMAQGGNPDMQAQADELTAQVQQMMQQGATAEQVQQQLMDAVKNGQIDEQVGSYVLQQLQGSQQQAPVARFGGNARALIRKALGGDMPEVDSTSNSYVQDRQAAFVKSVKKNALLHDFDNEFPSLKKNAAPKFDNGGAPKAGDYKTANEYKLALYEYNAGKTDAKDQVDIKDLSSKWTEPIAEGASGKWVGGKFVADAAPTIAEGASGKWIGGKFVPDATTTTTTTGGGGQYFNNTPEQQNLAKLQASPFGQLMSKSGWDHGDMNWNSSGLTNDPNAKFKVTHVEGKKGLFGRRKVAFDLDWSTAASAPGTIPPAPGTPVVPGTATNTQDIVEKKVGDQTLKFDKMGNQLQASKYNPNNFITAEQAVKEDENYTGYSEAVASKQYDPMTGKFADVQTDRPVNTSSWNNGTIYTQANPLPADDVKALQATMGLPETGVWDDAFTKSINDYKTKTFGKNANLNGSIGAETGDKLLADYTGRNFDDKTRIDKITTANPNAGMAGDYQNYTQFDANKNIKTATEAAEKAQRKGVLDKADAVYNQRGRVYKAFHDSPTENANEYQAKLDEVKAEEERQKALDAANPYTGQQRAFGGPSNDVVQSAMHILKMALGGMTYQNNYDFLPKAIDGGFGFKPMDDSELENMDFGVPVDETIKPKTEAEKLAEYQKGYNERLAVVDPKVAGEPIDLGKSGKGKITGKSKLKVSWGDAFEAANNGMERFGKWSDQMYRNTEDKNMAMNSAMNTTRTGMNDVGNFNQWGENEGGINRGDQINNMGNTYGAIDTPRFDGWNSEVIKAAMGGPMQFAHGGKVYDLGGSYDLTPEDVANLERLGIRLEKTR